LALTKPKTDGKPVQLVNLGSDNSSNLSGLIDGARGDWKFVIIDTKDARYLVLGPVSKFKYHAGMVKYFCELRNIACLTVKKPDLVQILDQAVLVRGGGRVRFDEPSETLHFYDSSRAYGSFSRYDLSPILDQSGLFEDLLVHIDPS
jgi:hypothetical protein